MAMGLQYGPGMPANGGPDGGTMTRSSSMPKSSSTPRPMSASMVGTTSMTSPTMGTVPGVSSKAMAPVQQTMGPGAGPMVPDATLSYMLRMTGELRSEQSSSSTGPPRMAELGLRPVVRPAKSTGPVTVEVRDEDGDQISIPSRSSSSVHDQ